MIPDTTIQVRTSRDTASLQASTSIAHLSDEMLLSIFEELHLKDLRGVLLCCKRWKILAVDAALIRRIVQRTHPRIYQDNISIRYASFWQAVGKTLGQLETVPSKEIDILPRQVKKMQNQQNCITLVFGTMLLTLVELHTGIFWAIAKGYGKFCEAMADNNSAASQQYAYWNATNFYHPSAH